MCFKIDMSRHEVGNDGVPIPQMATEDIQVVKVLRLNWKSSFVPENLAITYSPMQVTRCALGVEIHPDGARLSKEGLYSIGTDHDKNPKEVADHFRVALLRALPMPPDTMYKKAIIPKGALYYASEPKWFFGSTAYCSSELIVLDEDFKNGN